MDKLSYAFGVNTARNIMELGVKEINIEDFTKGFKDMITNENINQEEVNKVIKEFLANVEKERKEKEANEKKMGEKLLKETKDFTVTKSGLMYKMIKLGTGNQPSAHSRVLCHYEGKLPSGQKFDSSYDRNAPAAFGLDQVIPGWTEGLQLMTEGSEYEFIIPPHLGYGEAGVPGVIPPQCTLIFKVELIKVL